MIEKVRAKMVVHGVEAVGHDGKIEGYAVRMYPVTSGSKENEEFFNYTPAGSLNLSIVNEATAKFFEDGQEYYVDLTKAE